MLDDLLLQAPPASHFPTGCCACEGHLSPVLRRCFRPGNSPGGGRIILTGDPEFEEVRGIVEVEWIMEEIGRMPALAY